MAQRPQKTVFVSNLNLQTTDNEFEEAFKRFGPIKSAFVVKDKHAGDGPKSRGFGYIIFENATDLEKCVKSKVKLAGKTLKICKAKPKMYKGKKGSDKNCDTEDGDDDDEDVKTVKKNVKSKAKGGQVKKTQQKEDCDDDSDDDDDEETPKKINKCKTKAEQLKKKKNKCDDDDGDDDDDDEMVCEDDESDDDDMQFDDNNEVESVDNDDDDDEEEGDEDDDDEDYDDDDEEEDFEEDDEDKQHKPDRPINNNDAEDGRTIFLRNLSFDSVEDDLEEFFEEFGDLNYCRVVVDQKSGRSRGMAFVRFRTKESAEKCLEEFKNDPDRFAVSGRKLILALAVPKEEAKNKFQKQIGEESGSKRNLHLIRVTMIRPGTKAAEGMTNEDIQMRETVLAATKEKLKNPNIFVSTNRLCVRNIPFEVDDKRLRQAFLKAAGGGKDVRITESRIMRDLTKPRANGVFWSKGFGFVTFSSHEHALAAAMATNNVPIFGEKKRLVVDFSLENKAVYELRQKRLEKSKNPECFPKGERPKRAGGNKKFQPARAPNAKPGQKNLPSHTGPKIRHRPRNEKKRKGGKDSKKQQPQEQQNKQPQQQRNKQPQQQQLGDASQGKKRPKLSPMARKRKRNSVKEHTDSVDVMVKKRKMERSW